MTGEELRQWLFLNRPSTQVATRQPAQALPQQAAPLPPPPPVDAPPPPPDPIGPFSYPARLAHSLENKGSSLENPFAVWNIHGVLRKGVEQARDFQNKGADILKERAGIGSQKGVRGEAKKDDSPIGDDEFELKPTEEKPLQDSTFDPLKLAGIAQPQVIKAHPGQTVTKETEAGLVEGTEQVGKGTEALGAAKVASSTADEEAAKRQAAIYDDWSRRTEANEAHRQNVLSTHLDDQSKLESNLANNKIHLDDYWGDGWGGALKRTSAVIAMALAGFRGNVGEAAQVIDNGINEWIASKKQNFDIDKETLASKKDAYAQKRLQLGDARAADLAIKSDLLNAAAATAQQMKAHAQTDEQRANADILIGRWKQERAKLNDQIHPLIPDKLVIDPRLAQMEKLRTELIMKGHSDNEAAAIAMHRFFGTGPGGDLKGGAGGKDKGLPGSIIMAKSSAKTAVKLLDRMDQIEKDLAAGKISRSQANKDYADIQDLYASESIKAVSGNSPTETELAHVRSRLPPPPWDPSPGGVAYGVKQALGVGQSRQNWTTQQRSIMQAKDKEYDEISAQKRGIGGAEDVEDK